MSALLIVGFRLNDAHSARAAGASTTFHTTTTTSASGSTTSHDSGTTTTQPQGTSKTLPPPIVNMAAFRPPGAGCRFSTGAPNPNNASNGTPTSSIPKTSAMGHCTVLEIGDSLGNDLGWGLARQLGHNSEVRLVQADKSSSGLLTPWFYNWPKEEKVFLAQYKPQLVVIMFGANDEQNLKVNGQVLAFGSAPWVRAYTHIVTAIASTATKTGAYVLWVGMPIMQPNSYRLGMVLLNSVYAKVMTSTLGMTFLPTWDLLANARGQFIDAARVNNIPSILREADGIHLSFVGENVLSTYVTRAIGAVYHVAIAPESAMYINR